MADIEKLNRRLGQMKSSRSPFEMAWDDCRTFALPDSSPIYGEYVRPTEKSRKNYDATAELELRNLSSVLMASITNPSTKWVQIESDDETVNKEADAKLYFEELEKTVMKMIDNSNCYSKLQEFYHALAGFGTAVMLIEGGDYGKALNFRTFHISEIFLSENYQGDVDTVYRRFKMTARDMIQEFGMDKVSDKVKKRYEKEPDELITVCHAVYPREDDLRKRNKKGDFLPDKMNMPWAGVWYEEENKHQLKETGYRLFPFAVVRWFKNPTEVYGRSPIMSAMADIKTLNRMVKSNLQLAEKISNPPLAIIGSEGQEVKLTPGAVNHFDDEVVVHQLVPGGNFPITDAAIARKENTIKESLYANQLYNINTIDKEMTASEVHARRMENLKILGPVFSRIQTELLEPFINRGIDVLHSEGQLPKPPESLAGKIFKYRFINPLARAQQQDEIASIEFALSRGAQLAAVDPQVLDNIDMDKVFNLMVELSGAPLTIMRPPKDVKAIRQQRQAQQAQQQDIQQTMVQADVAETQAKVAEKMSRAEKYRRGA